MVEITEGERGFAGGITLPFGSDPICVTTPPPSPASTGATWVGVASESVEDQREGRDGSRSTSAGRGVAPAVRMPLIPRPSTPMAVQSAPPVLRRNGRSSRPSPPAATRAVPFFWTVNDLAGVSPLSSSTRGATSPVVPAKCGP